MSTPRLGHALLQQQQQQQQQQLGGGFPRLTVARVRRWLDSGAVSSVEICTYCYALAIAGESSECRWNLGAFERLIPFDQVLDQARASDQRRKRNQHAAAPTPPTTAMDGIPVSLKANLAVASQPLTAGSRILGLESPQTVARSMAERMVLLRTGSTAAPVTMASTTLPPPPLPVGYNAEVTDHLLRSGAVLIGCTTMDEFGMGSLGRSSATHGEMTRNPLPLLHRPRRNNTASDDESALQAIRTPLDDILEAHIQIAEALKQCSYDDDIGHDHDDADHSFSAGGSSCGSAVSVAHGSSLVSLGSDTGGSVRLPAAWCACVGFKPTYGLLSRHGLVSYASSLDTIGILAPTVACATAVLDCLLPQTMPPISDDSHGNGASIAAVAAAWIPHCRDSNQTIPPKAVAYRSSIRTLAQPSATVDTEPAKTLLNTVKESLSSQSDVLCGMRIGIPAALSVTECPACVVDAWSHAATCLEHHGAVVEPVALDCLAPDVIQQALAAYYILVSAEASSNLNRYDGLRYGFSATNVLEERRKRANKDTGTTTLSLLEQQYSATRALGFGPEVIRRILCGSAVLSSDRFHTHYEGAAKLRAILIQQLEQVLGRGDGDHEGRNDLLLFPTTIYPPPKKSDTASPTEVFANDVMTVPASLAGLPAISVPFGEWDHDNRFQIGLQLVAPRFGEANLLRVANVLEQGKHWQ